MTFRKQIEDICREIAIGVTSKPFKDGFTVSMPLDPEEATDAILQAFRERVPKKAEIKTYDGAPKYPEDEGFNQAIDRILRELE